MVFGVCPRGTAQILIAQNRNIFCGIDTSSARLAKGKRMRYTLSVIEVFYPKQ